MNFISKLFDFIIPRFCTSCKTQLTTSELFICKQCFAQINLLSDTEIDEEYKRKFENTNFVDDYTSLFVFEESGKLQDLIHALKYDNKFKIGCLLGNILGEGKLTKIKTWNADLIIPIPLFHLKKVERGYNQADYIAKGLTKILGIKTNTSIAKRVKNTVTQTKLNKANRSINMQDAFSIRKPKLVKGKNIIVVDDVITTGTTILELAKKMKEDGTSKVYALSVATPLVSHSIRG